MCYCRLLQLFVAAIVLSGICIAAETDRPNLIAIVTDDQGQWAMGAYGNKDVKTPNMDRIAAEGALFVNAFTATPVCSPSRATYFTGRYPTELGITDWIAPQESDAGLGMRGLSWPQVLRKNGYRTALIGKWHLGSKPEFHPTRMGFDHFMGFLGGGTRPMHAELEVAGKLTATKGPLPDVLTDDAIRFVRESASRPFALCLHFRAPHLPYGPVPQEDSDLYKDVDPEVPSLPGLDTATLKRSTRDYYASISSVDRNLGRLLKALDDLKLSRNTLVIFTSDHGYNEGRHYIKTKGNGGWMAGGINGPMRPNMWDTSIRVPLAMRWPATIKAGTRPDHMVSNLDTFRTVLGALKVPLPEKCPAHGLDYSPLLRGEPLKPRGEIFGQYDLHNGGLAYMRMIRTERFKYVRYFKANSLDELYDLQADPDEQRNLLRPAAKSSAEALSNLRGKLQAWQESIDDPILKSAY
jgi:uncharacterized sulfatase